MPAKDFYHEHVRNALTNEGWTVTHEHLKAPWLKTAVQIDLAAERMIAAEKDTRKIAVEVKSFLGVSTLADLYGAIGQFILYRLALGNSEPERILFLAIPEVTFNDVFQHPDGIALREREQIKLLVFHSDNEEIVQWIE